MMNAYYNHSGVGDVLMLALEECPREERTAETKGDVVRICNGKGEAVAYNIFNASTYITELGNGPLEVNEEFVQRIRDIFQKNKVEDELEVDVRPKFVVGYVTEKKPHENADKLSVCQVDVGDGIEQIVCGAANVAKGQKVVVARVGATMPSGLEIKASNLRGEDSNGMICSREELGLPKDPEENGIYVLEEDAVVGTPFAV